VPEIGQDGIEDGEDDIPVEAEPVDCGAMACCPWTTQMEATTTLRCDPWIVIDSLPIDRSWYTRRELTAKSSGRNPNRSPQKALRVIRKKAVGRRTEGGR
jgi:hypothetical protein